MMLSVPVMVSVDKRQVYDLLLPGISPRTFRGVSLAELLDDVALHLMETIPQRSPAKMSIFQLCPNIELRRVKVEVELPGEGRKKETWAGRVTVVVTRWSEDDFYEVFVPRLGTDGFAVERTSFLADGLAHFLAAWCKRNDVHYGERLEFLTSKSYEYLEILEVDTEMPTVLPSRQPTKKKKKKKDKKKSQDKKASKPKKQMVYPRTLRQVGVNLTHKAMDHRLGLTFGRDGLVDQILMQLQRPGAALLLVGPSGVGKTAVIYEVVRRLAQQRQNIKDRTDVWGVDGNRIIAGMSMVGAWEQRCKDMVHELHQRQDILYVADLPTLVYTGRSAHSDSNVAQYLEPHMARAELRVLGECTPERLEATRDQAPGFFSRFQIIQVPELDERQTLMVLVHAMRSMEAAESVHIEPEVLETVLALTRRFQPRQCHPGKAVTLLERLLGDHQDVELDDYGRRRITRSRLVDFFARQTGLPRFVLWEQQSRSWSQIHEHFVRRIIGQAAASQAAAQIVTVLQQGLNDPSRPLATLLFVGPTGVGKTETAKALAEYLFGHKNRLIRFDMSEFRDPGSVARLFGDRFQPEGELTRRVEQHPFSVVLFDEIEKAHPRVFDAFLQVFGEGRLTNAAGRTTDFCNTILIMTSNLGVRQAERSLGFGGGDGASQDLHYRKAAEQFFRPEFFNRIDQVVPFRALDRDAMAPLVKRILTEILGRRGLRRSGVLVRVEPDLTELLMDQGFDPRYGARSMRRALEQRLTVPLARHLVTQPVDRTTLVQLYRHGEDIGMDLWALEDKPVQPMEPWTVEGWPDLERRFLALRAHLDGIQASPSLAALEKTRGGLLRDFNEDRLDPAQWGRLQAANHLLANLSELRREMDEFQSEYMERYHFIEQIDQLSTRRSRIQRNYNATHTRPVQSTIELPAAVDRDMVFLRSLESLRGLERSVAEASYRSLALQRDEDSVLVRLLPATDDPDAVNWMLDLALSLMRAWYSWGDLKPFALREGQWEPTTREQLDRHTRGVALWLRGFGAQQITRDELGFQMNTFHSGPDLVCNLVRVEDVGLPAPGQEVCAWLQELDQRWDAWRAARRDGQPRGPHPRPQLLVLRRLSAGEGEDPQTGVALRLEPEEQRSHLRGLKDVLARRLLLLPPQEASPG